LEFGDIISDLAIKSKQIKLGHILSFQLHCLTTPFWIPFVNVHLLHTELIN